MRWRRGEEEKRRRGEEEKGGKGGKKQVCALREGMHVLASALVALSL